ncbi:MAG: hypothetical protein R2880_02140 [Deinococcales bacterium]
MLAVEEQIRDDDLSNQRVLAGTEGNLAYYRKNETGTYQIMVVNQVTDEALRVWSGNQEIQSVALDGEVRFVVASMMNGEYYDIYLFDLTTKQMINLTNSSDRSELDVSMTADGTKIVYSQANDEGISQINICEYDKDGQSCSVNVLSTGRAQLQGSITSNGSYIALVRELDETRDRILLYDVVNNSYKAVVTREAELSHPSSTDDGSKVMYLLDNTAVNGRYVVRIKDLVSNVINAKAASRTAEHPFLYPDGEYFSYSLLNIEGLNRVLTRDIEDRSERAVSRGNGLKRWSYHQPYWQRHYIEPATLVVKKVIISDNGESVSADAFKFKVNGGVANRFELDGENRLTVDVGTYNIVEVAAEGFTASYEGCENVTLSAGEVKTCTITNNGNPATLIVKKVLITDNGSSAVVSDFSFSINEGEAIAFEEDGENSIPLAAGTYSVVETEASGFNTSYEGCTDIVLANGETKTCTITNDDAAATLIVKKVLITDDGSSAVMSDFSFSINEGETVEFEEDGENSIPLAVGTYSVVETEASGFSTTYEGCTDIVLANGEVKTCTITNDDVRLLPQIYVKADATGSNNGNSWADAYTSLQDALAAWNATQHIHGIWVAKGVYYPDEGDGLTDNDRALSFNLKEGMKLYGGFAGTESAESERNPATNVTILSGDIDKNDTNTDGDNIANTSADIQGSNSYHVVVADGTITPITSVTLIDGFVVTAGMADGDSDRAGGGMYCNGNGIDKDCSPSLSRISFIGNQANYSGGGLFNSGTLSGSSSPTLTNVSFFGNSAYRGGALFNDGSGYDDDLTDDIPDYSGSSNPTLTNVSFVGNSASDSGGAMYNFGDLGSSNPTLTNVSFVSNSANSGGAMYNFGDSDVTSWRSPIIKNSIFWDNNATNSDPEIFNNFAFPYISHSLFAGALPTDSTDAGNNLFNTSTSPFVNVANGDLQLAACSPAIDAGDNSANSSTTDLAGTLVVKKVLITDEGSGEVVSDFSFSINEGEAISFEEDGENSVELAIGTYSVVETAANGFTTTYRGLYRHCVSQW